MIFELHIIKIKEIKTCNTNGRILKKLIKQKLLINIYIIILKKEEKNKPMYVWFN